LKQSDLDNSNALTNHQHIKPEDRIMITNEQLMTEVREANMSYLMLAQHMLREDRDQAMYRLGLSEEVADMIAALTPGQLLKIANSNMLMCRFRFDDDVVWGLLLSHGKQKQANDAINANAIHAGILMASHSAKAERLAA
jgi:flagellar transcriptional activator FlhD